mgnify:FL=1
MAVSYNRLWKLLVDKKMSKADLRKASGVAPNTMTKLRRDEEVTLTHRATSRQIFVNGALAAAQKLVAREPGFYTFDQVMFA